jgi:hypothetical protein
VARFVEDRRCYRSDGGKGENVECLNSLNHSLNIHVSRVYRCLIHEFEAALVRSELHPADLKVGFTASAYPPPTKTAPAAATAAADDVIAPHRFNIRIRKIVKVQRHPGGALYVKNID